MARPPTGQLLQAVRMISRSSAAQAWPSGACPAWCSNNASTLVRDRAGQRRRAGDGPASHRRPCGADAPPASLGALQWQRLLRQSCHPPGASGGAPTVWRSFASQRLQSTVAALGAEAAGSRVASAAANAQVRAPHHWGSDTPAGLHAASSAGAAWMHACRSAPAARLFFDRCTMPHVAAQQRCCWHPQQTLPRSPPPVRAPNARRPSPWPRPSQAHPSLALTAGMSVALRRQVAWWLGGCSAWVFSMVVIGGVTRLTRSGLSMTEWKFTGEFLVVLQAGRGGGSVWDQWAGGAGGSVTARAGAGALHAAAGEGGAAAGVAGAVTAWRRRRRRGEAAASRHSPRGRAGTPPAVQASGRR